MLWCFGRQTVLQYSCSKKVQQLELESTIDTRPDNYIHPFTCPESTEVMSQSMHLLFLFVLLLYIHSISSTSLLSMKKLTREELLVHTTGANMTNLATLVGPSLAGYYTEVYYSDAACSAVLYSEQYQLQVCTPWINGASFIATFNGTHTLTNTYRDTSCTIFLRNFLAYGPIQVCGRGLTVSVTTSSPTITSSTPLLSAA